MYRNEYSECFGCDEKDNKIDNVKYWLKYLLEQLYSKTAFDCDEFERCLQELCSEVSMKIPKEELCVEHKASLKIATHPMQKTFDIGAWKDWNNNYLKSVGGV
jgi:hypothetical protein